MVNLVWLRRDLRLHDHAALHAALQEDAPVQPIFIFDTDILARFSNPEDKRLSFLMDALLDLNSTLQRQGGRLLIFHGKATDLMPKIVKDLKAGKVFAAEDYEPGTIKRDEAVGEQVELVLRQDHVMAHPESISKDDSEPYKVFTPYSKAWHAACNDSFYDERVVEDKGRYAQNITHREAFDLRESAENLLNRMGYRYVEHGWPVDEASKRLKHFAKDILGEYKAKRDMLAEDGTSQISPYLRFGLVSIRECYRAAQGKDGAGKWISELIWREFYQMILFRFPDSVRQEFQEQYRGTIDWSDSKGDFERWQEGKTGYPVVDAGMRQLKEMGWMHNRARMIVAAFLTKDLLIDWRKGEEHFAQYLMDYELASNVGGWQWAASTGTDAQPYFRIFNPILQGKKFDPEGEYVKRWVSELKDMPKESIHEPWKEPLLCPDYPERIVDHFEVRKTAIEVFKKAAGKD